MRDKHSSVVHSTPNRCSKLPTCSRSFCGGQGRCKKTPLEMSRCFSADQDGAARLCSTCTWYPAHTAEAVYWSSCSERKGKDPCLSPGVDLQSSPVHALMLSPRSETLSIATACLCMICAATVPLSPRGCYNPSIFWQRRRRYSSLE